MAQPGISAADCAPPTPECHLAKGKALIDSDPKQAAAQLLASFKLDERTDTLELYARALEKDGQRALALDTWKRVVVFRESELDAAKAARGKKGAVAKAQQNAETAAQAILQLWAKVGRVRVRVTASHAVTVWRGGVEVDAAREIAVNAGRDELAFTRTDGSLKRVPVTVGAGETAELEISVEATAPVEAPAPQMLPVVTRPAKEPAPARYVEETRSPGMAKVGLGVAAAGVVALGVAATFGYLAGRDYDDAEDLGCRGDGLCPVGPAVDLAERSNDRARVAQITGIGGGALLAPGAVLWLVGRGTTRRAVADVAFRIDQPSVTVGWRF